MYGRAFPGGNVLFFFGCESGLFCLPGGEGPLAFLAVETLQNGRIEAPGQTLDDLIGVNRSVDDFFLSVQVHLLFRSTAWLLGIISLQSPKCGMREAGPALLQSQPPKFFCEECRNTRPRRPSRPERAPSGGFMGRRGGFKKQSERNKMSMRFIFANTGEGRVGREIFTSRPNFIRGRNRGGHTRPDSPGSRPRCAWKSGYHTGPRS